MEQHDKQDTEEQTSDALEIMKRMVADDPNAQIEFEKALKKARDEQLAWMSNKITELTLIIEINQSLIKEINSNMAAQTALTSHQKDKMDFVYHTSKKALKDN